VVVILIVILVPIVLELKPPLEPLEIEVLLVVPLLLVEEDRLLPLHLNLHHILLDLEVLIVMLQLLLPPLLLPEILVVLVPPLEVVVLLALHNQEVDPISRFFSNIENIRHWNILT
jgi:hypothetical protein